MRMVLEILAPSVKHGDDADFGTEVPAICGNCGQRVSGGLEEETIDFRLVLIAHRPNHGRQGENEMKIRNRQNLGFARRKPCRRGPPLAFRAVPIAARIIGDADVCTVLATLDMTAERGSATDLDCRHDTALGEVDVAGVGRAPRLTMAAENLGHLEFRSNHVGRRSEDAGSPPSCRD